MFKVFVIGSLASILFFGLGYTTAIGTVKDLSNSLIFVKEDNQSKAIINKSISDLPEITDIKGLA